MSKDRVNFIKATLSNKNIDSSVSKTHSNVIQSEKCRKEFESISHVYKAIPIDIIDPTNLGGIDIETRFLDQVDRNRYYRQCHGIAKQYRVYREMRDFMKARWKKESMTELTDSALHVLLAYMRSLEAYINKQIDNTY